MSIRKNLSARLALLTAAVGLLSGAPPSSATPAHGANSAHIVGSIRDAGPGEYVKRPGTVTLHDGAHRVIARQHVQTGHRFDFKIRPGQYYLSMKSPHCFYSPSSSREIQYVPVQARAHRTTHVTIYCAVR